MIEDPIVRAALGSLVCASATAAGPDWIVPQRECVTHERFERPQNLSLYLDGE